jgi:hypothetical protein
MKIKRIVQIVFDADLDDEPLSEFKEWAEEEFIKWAIKVIEVRE